MNSFINRLQTKTENLKVTQPVTNLECSPTLGIYRKNISDKINALDIKQKILHYRENNPDNLSTNVRAWRSSWLLHKKTNVFANLVKELESIGKDFYECDNLPNCTLKVNNFWAIIYGDNEYARWHDHGHETLSLIYYVDVTPKTAPIEFENGDDSFKFYPDVGDVVLIHGLNRHKVSKLNQNSRIVMAANLHFIKNEL